MPYRLPPSEEFPSGLSRVLLVLWQLWFLLYLGMGALALMNSETSFLARTVEHMKLEWVQLTFLNIPLQAGIAIVALGCQLARRDGLRWFVFLLAVTDIVLAAGHLGLGLWYELT